MSFTPSTTITSEDECIFRVSDMGGSQVRKKNKHETLHGPSFQKLFAPNPLLIFSVLCENEAID